MNTDYLHFGTKIIPSTKPSTGISMSWVFLFVCLFSFSPKAFAQISILKDWTSLYNSTTTTTALQTVNYTVPVGSNTSRVLVIAIATSRETTGSRTVTLTYGGRSFSSVQGDILSNERQHTQLYILVEADLDAATNSNLVFSVSGGTTILTNVFAAVFDGVDQTTPTPYAKSFANTNTSNPIFGTALSINAYDQAVVVVSSLRMNQTNPRTIEYATDWTMAAEQSLSGTHSVTNGVANRSVPTVNTTDFCSTTFSGRSLASMNAMTLKVAAPIITSLSTSSGCEGSQITINGTNFGTVTAADVKIGGTPVTSIVSNTNTQIVAVVGTGTSGLVTVSKLWGTATSASSFTVNTAPTVTLTASQTTVDSGGNVTLTASTNQNTVLLYEGFNDETNTWTNTNNSTGANPENAAWSLRPNGYTYAYPGYPENVFNSNDNSQFYLSNSSEQDNNSTTATLLQSPSLNSTGYTSLSLEFYQYNLDFDATDFALVQVSTNGIDWTTLSTTTTTQGQQNNFLKTTINLDAYINQTSLYIRFKYDAQFDWFWAIDNVTISGYKSATYSWTALPSGTAGLPTDAGTALTSNNSIVAKPVFSTDYNVTATNTTTGCTGTAQVRVTVLTPTITSLSSTSGCIGSSITINGTNLSGATAATVTIGGTAVSSITAISATQIVAVIGSGTTGKVAVTNPGGTAISTSDFIVNPTVTINVFSPTTSTRCQGAGIVTTTTTANNSSGITYSLDGISASFPGNSINSSTGAVTYAANWTGTTRIMASAAGCNGPATTTHQVTVSSFPTITTQPINQLDCEGSIVTFNVVASGTSLSYVWQRKLPTDTGFTTIPVETNVSYPTPDKIRLQNIGSTLSLDGTQYRVIVSNSSSCSVTSNPAVLSVNEIENVTGGTNVSQCAGTNYAYTVTTSYPANVVSYQWKSSVASGIWNTVVDGAHFSGATTATLNIVNGTSDESAEYRVYITFASSAANCNVSSASRTRMITFLPVPTTPVISVTQPTCSSATGTISVTIQNTNHTYSFDNGLTYQGMNNVKSGLTTGNYTVVIKNTQNCVSPTTAATINLQPITPVQPTLNLAVLPTCKLLGSFTITNYNPTYLYAVTPNTGVTASGNTISAPAGNYTLIATLGSCSSIASSNINLPSIVTNTWTTNGWSTGSAPVSNNLENVILDADYSTSTNGDLCACSVTLNSGKTLNIATNDTAVIQKDLTVNGVLDVADQGSLIMIDDTGIVTNNGTTTIRKRTSLFEKYDYIYWSTPVSTTNIPSTFTSWKTNYAFEFLTANFLDLNNDSFDDDQNDWLYASTMSPGKGYIIMTPINKTTYPRQEDIVFSGKVNNGVITVPIALSPSVIDQDDDFNLVGNPYPSAISADEFIIANINSTSNTGPYKTIEGTLYFWTHIGDISKDIVGPYALNYSSDDYAVYTLAGGVGTGGNRVAGVRQDSNKPTGFIASGQGFFVEADKAGTLLFNNAMRVGTETKNNNFYKLQSDTKKTASTVKDRIWLNLENTSNMFSQQLIGYFDTATMGYDKGYDGPFSDAGNYINFYSFIDTNTYKIQGRSSFDEKDQVPLGFSSAVAGTFTISIDSKEGVFENTNQPVLLEDKLTQTLFNLKNGSYSFTTEKGTFNDRFVLRYTENTLGVDENNTANGISIFYSNNKTVTITNNSDALINSVSVYNIAGQNITQSNLEDAGQTTIQIPINNVSSGVYIVKVKTTKGEISDKIIVK